MQPKPLDTHVAYKETWHNYALSDALSYITWGLSGMQTRGRREPFRHILNEKEKSQGLEKIKIRNNTIDWDSKIEKERISTEAKTLF